MKYNKYKQPKLPETPSKTALEIKRLLATHEPPIEIKEAAEMADVHFETMRSVISNQRCPSQGIIYALGRKLDWSTRQIDRLLSLRREDQANKKLTDAFDRVGKPTEQIATAISLLSKDQQAKIAEMVLKMASNNKKPK